MPKKLAFPASLPKRIRVSLSNHREGRYRDPHHGPLALALREVLKKRLGYEPDVGVEEDHTWIRLADKRTFIAHHNQKVEIYVNDFDGKFEVPKPGSFRFHWTREIQRRRKRSKDITELLGSRKQSQGIPVKAIDLD